MNDNTPLSKEEIKLVCVHTGLQPKNLKTTYIGNDKKEGKPKILNVFRLGAVCADEDLTLDEAQMAVMIVKYMREFNAK